jgi:2-C-methyl-D-erythritol 4-phosphate cytidylyltransferase
VHVTAVVVADDVGLDPLTRIAGVPMVVRSVRRVLASGVADQVMIDASERVLRACAGLPVRAWEPQHASARIRAHAGQRAGGTVGDDQIADVLLVHDAARPLTPPALFTAALAAVLAGADAVVPVLPVPDTVKLVDGDGVVLGTPDRAGLRVVQTPCAFRAAVWDVHSALLAQPACLAAQTIPGDLLAFPVRTAWDLELAGLLADA